MDREIALYNNWANANRGHFYAAEFPQFAYWNSELNKQLITCRILLTDNLRISGNSS